MSFVLDNLKMIAMGFADQPNIYSYNCGSDSLATVSGSGYFDAAINQVKDGDKILIKSDTSGISFSGTFRNDATHVYIDFDNTLYFQTQMADVSTGSSAYIAVPPVGVITKVYGLLWTPVTVASATVDFAIGASAITGGSLTITTGGSNGQYFSATPTALNITDGASAVHADSDGGSTTTAILTVGFKIICGSNI